MKHEIMLLPFHCPGHSFSIYGTVELPDAPRSHLPANGKLFLLWEII